MSKSTLRSVLTLTVRRSNIIFYRNVAVNAAAENQETVVVEGKPWRELPGLPSLPVIGQMYHFLPGGVFYKTAFLDAVKIMTEKYGRIIRFEGLGRPPMVILSDPESSGQILRAENRLPIRPGLQSLEYYRKTYKKNKGTDQPTGLITDHNEPWKRFRSTVNPVMMQPKTIKLYNSAIDEVAKDMIQRIKTIREDENWIKNRFDVEMNLWALESVGVIALGGRLNCLDLNLPEDAPARQLINVVHAVFDISESLDLKPSLWRYIWTPSFQKAMNVYAEQERITKYFIDIAKQDLKTKPKTDDEKGVLEKLLDIDEHAAHIMASDMLFAGVDTTANTMTFALYHLAKNPEKQEKLRQEILSEPDKKTYLKACIKEAIRLDPVAPGNIRQISRDYNIMGYKIPKDTQVFIMHQLMGRKEENFIRASEFIPERWLVPKDDPLNYGNAPLFAYNPFGFGVRMCIGRRIAELEVETFLRRMIQNFKVEWSGPPLIVKQTLIHHSKPPYYFVFKDL